MGNPVLTSFVGFFLQEDLVCDDASWTSHIKLIFYIGVLVGDIGFGLIADMYVMDIHF